jgi:cell wall assembly regulator SMI1
MQDRPEMIVPRVATSADAINAFESSHGIRLPADYRKFLLATNGGRPKLANFPVDGFPHAETWDIAFFMSIGGGIPTQELAYALELYAGGLPDGVLPIAGDDGGNYICLDMRDGGEKVVFWEKSHFWSTGEWREQDLHRIAASLREFFASLGPSPY